MGDHFEETKKITSIDLSNNDISAVSGLEGCVDLEELHLEGNNITSTEGIDECTGLRRCYLSDNNISDISYLSSLPLDVLILENNGIVDATVEDISSYTFAATLEVLDLSDNDIENIGINDVYVYSHLTCLDLSNNSIEVINYLSALVNLNYLNLSGNLLTAFPYLGSQQVFLSETVGSDDIGFGLHLSNNLIEVLDYYADVRYLDVSGNDIVSLIRLADKTSL
jgi:Leucine-rich repeat (LRR) protein